MPQIRATTPWFCAVSGTQLANTSGNPAYAEAAALVARMAALRDAAGHVAYLAVLKARFGRKRNFMMLFP